MIICRTIDDLRSNVKNWRQQSRSVGLVPTMGGLHDGHLSLVKLAQQHTDKVIATLFVNPAQFSPEEDFVSYPRDENRDRNLFEATGVDLMFAPTVKEMYPDDHATRIEIDGISQILEGAHRPHFFGGVATIVAKLLLEAMPDMAIFGEKDYQQLCVIRKMVQDLDIPVSIIGAPTIREHDGLAMSSRNRYLTSDERLIAPELHRTLSTIAKRIRQGERPQDIIPWAKVHLAQNGFGQMDYIEVCDAETLLPTQNSDRPVRVLAAIKLGKARLIDNITV